MKPTGQLRWVLRDGERVLQQRWQLMNNWAESAHEWRDVLIEEETT